MNECSLHLFVDASYAGDLNDSKSTSGGILCLMGSQTFVPIAWLCKKQSAISHSSSEAEIIALDTGVRMDALPCLSLWSQILDIFHPTFETKQERDTFFDIDSDDCSTDIESEEAVEPVVTVTQKT